MDKDDGDWSLHTLRPKRDRRRVSLLLASRAISARCHCCQDMGIVIMVHQIHGWGAWSTS